jgi:hypothetical protein
MGNIHVASVRLESDFEVIKSVVNTGFTNCARRDATQICPSFSWTEALEARVKGKVRWLLSESVGAERRESRECELAACAWARSGGAGKKLESTCRYTI